MFMQKQINQRYMPDEMLGISMMSIDGVGLSIPEHSEFVYSVFDID